MAATQESARASQIEIPTGAIAPKSGTLAQPFHRSDASPEAAKLTKQAQSHAR